MGTQKLLLHSFIILSIIAAIHGQQPTSEIPEFDASADGKNGNPGAKIRLSDKALNSIYDDAVSKVAETIKSLKLPDVTLPIGGGILAIRSARIIDVKIPNYSRDLVPSNVIKSRLYGAHIKSEGEWQYRPQGYTGQYGSFRGGKFRTMVFNAELNTTTKLDRTNDGRPVVSTSSCNVDLGQFQVEIEGYGNDSKPTVINQCNNFLCKSIESFFQDQICNAGKKYVTEVINKKLSSFPTRVNLGPGNQFVMDYRLSSSDMVSKENIYGDLKGGVLSRSNAGANFHPVQLALKEMTRELSFSLSDFALNSLWYQAHHQQFPFSAYQLLENSPHSNLLLLNCSAAASASASASSASDDVRSLKSTSKSTRSTTTRRSTTTQKPTSTSTTRRSTSTRRPSSSSSTQKVARFEINSSFGVNPKSPKCLGSIFDNETDGQVGMGNLIFKSQQPVQFFVNEHPKQSWFANKNGLIEIYGAGDHSDKFQRSAKLLYRVGVKSLNGQFFPKMDLSNISGSVEIQNLELMQVQQQQQPATRGGVRSVSNEQLVRLAEFSKPILNAMFSSFLAEYAQFPVPLPDGYECSEPGFRWSDRTMQIDCDIRVLSN